LCPVLRYFGNHWSRVQIPDPYPLDLSLKKRELPNTGTYYIHGIVAPCAKSLHHGPFPP
jgi:hypothetical protein